MSLEFVNTQNHFFSDRTSLARPSAFVRLVSFKRWPRYHTAGFRQPLFSKNFTIVCNPLSRNKMKTHFFLVFLLSASLPHPADAFPRTKRPRATTKIDAGPNKKRFLDIPYDSSIDLKQPGHHRPTFPRPSCGRPRPIGAWKRLEDKQDKRGQGKNHASPFPFGNSTFLMLFYFLRSPCFPAFQAHRKHKTRQDAAPPKAQSTQRETHESRYA